MATKTSARTNVSSGGAYESIFGYSRAVRAGNDVHVSGTCAPAGHEKSDAYTQARAALVIIEKALGEAGAKTADVVRTVVYVRSDDREALSTVWSVLTASEVAAAFTSAATLLGVAQLGYPGQLVEVDVTAVLPA